MPDAINLTALPAVTRHKVRLARKRGARWVFVRLNRRGYSVSTTGGDGWALVLG